MPIRFRIIASVLAGLAYWFVVSRISGTSEPWDAAGYWRLWYPASLALSAAAGYVLGKRGWLAGLLVTFAQLPVMWIGDGSVGNLWVAGLATLCVLALPAVAVAAAAGLFSRRVRH